MVEIAAPIRVDIAGAIARLGTTGRNEAYPDVVTAAALALNRENRVELSTLQLVFAKDREAASVELGDQGRVGAAVAGHEGCQAGACGTDEKVRVVVAGEREAVRPACWGIKVALEHRRVVVCVVPARCAVIDRSKGVGKAARQIRTWRRVCEEVELAAVVTVVNGPDQPLRGGVIAKRVDVDLAHVDVQRIAGNAPNLDVPAAGQQGGIAADANRGGVGRAAACVVAQAAEVPCGTGPVARSAATEPDGGATRGRGALDIRVGWHARIDQRVGQRDATNRVAIPIAVEGDAAALAQDRCTHSDDVRSRLQDHTAVAGGRQFYGAIDQDGPVASLYLEAAGIQFDAIEDHAA